MDKLELMTVGQLAKKVGTTVRTIQYYDQQGLLSPSAKGPANQRLYSRTDEEELYRILTLKYLGLPLAEIRECKDQIGDAMALRRLLVKAMEEIEESFQDLVKRLLTLHALFSESGRSRDVQWEALAHAIKGDGAAELFWEDESEEGGEA
ncbi:MAG: MerR family transcriptional regulator [Eggerthellaceae bacterium]|nr:MerR family transcriptional regulator [Eggerthellaceae bacterium]